MKEAKCPNCGASITIDETKKAGICKYCETAFVTEDAITNYNITNNVVNNITANSINISKDNVQNLLELLKNTINSKNYEKAYEISDKILTIDNTIAEVWYDKGISSGWMSTTQNNRLLEAVNCFIKSNSLDKNTYNYDLLYNQFCDLAFAILQLCGQQLLEYTSEDSVNTMISNKNKIVNCYNTFKQIDLNESLNSNFINLLYLQIYNICSEVYQNIKDEFGTNPSKMTDYNFTEYLSKACLIEDILDDLSKSDDDVIKSLVLPLLITISNDLINSCSYTWGAVSMFNDGYIVNKSLTDEAKRIRIKNINKWSVEIDNIKAKHLEKYWEEHKEERIKITNEISSNEQKIKELSFELSKLKLFDFKKKSQIKKEIEQLNNNISRLNNKLSNPNG